MAQRVRRWSECADSDPGERGSPVASPGPKGQRVRQLQAEGSAATAEAPGEGKVTAQLELKRQLEDTLLLAGPKRRRLDDDTTDQPSPPRPRGHAYSNNLVSPASPANGLRRGSSRLSSVRLVGFGSPRSGLASPTPARAGPDTPMPDADTPASCGSPAPDCGSTTDTTPQH
eukprot:comp12471_c0_seq1/m.7412 comp12471_c0_seq1/g.7412  ORF comp12471_c0_seq1/g.7412 comp12471_c0_seq1/m.7412 type:complete len:172 (-) comp12471_c0_seq1:641-1156(-)